MNDVIGVVRWVAADEVEDAWRPWLVAELAAVLAADRVEPWGPVSVRRADVEAYPYAERLRPPWPAHLVVADVGCFNRLDASRGS